MTDMQQLDLEHFDFSLRRHDRGACRRTDGARSGDRRWRPRAEHEARLRGRARRRGCNRRQAAARRAEGDRHQAGDDGRRRVRPAVRHLLHDARQGTAGRAGEGRTQRRLCQGGRRGGGAGKIAGRAKDDARRALPRGASAGGGFHGRRYRRRGRRGGGGDRADEGDSRPRLVPRRPFDRPHGCRRALRRRCWCAAVAEALGGNA